VSFLAGLLFWFILSCSSWCVGQASVPHSHLPQPEQSPEADNAQRARAEAMAKKANHERQAQLKHDTDSLLKLATELKQYVDKSSENTLSLDVVKKADQIEKLAHSVRERMKGN
jgi:nitric oxide reductase activation protein